MWTESKNNANHQELNDIKIFEDLVQIFRDILTKFINLKNDENDLNNKIVKLSI